MEMPVSLGGTHLRQDQIHLHSNSDASIPFSDADGSQALN